MPALILQTEMSDLRDPVLSRPLPFSSLGFDPLLGIWSLGFGICSGDGLLRGVREVVRRDQSRRVGTFFQQLLPSLDIRSFQTNNQWHGQFYRFCCVDDALRDDVAFHDPAENVYEDRFYFLVRDQDLECFSHLLLRRAAAYVEQVGRLSALKFDDVD